MIKNSLLSPDPDDHCMVHAMPWHDNADANVRMVRVCDRETMACCLPFPIGAEPPPGSGYMGWLSQRSKGMQSGQPQLCALFGNFNTK
jgi:hypothetical protein